MNPIIYPGSSSFFPGKTAFNFYDNDYQFQVDADKVTTFVARRLGYPIQNVELQDINFYTAFEEAITTYGNELYAYKLRDNYLSVEGLTTTTNTNLNNSIVAPNMGTVIRIAEQYGSEAGVGGNVTYHTGSISMSANIQDYDLNAWAVSQSIANNDIEIKRIFYQESPAITRFFDPYAGTGTGMINLMDAFGFGGFSPAINFLMMPMNFDLQKIQAIELNDQIRKSNFSFEITNNNLRIFPIPTRDAKLYFQYILKSERLANSIVSNNTGSVSNVSNVPYKNPVYSQINAIGRQWVFEYTLALCKEMLGYVRGKYSTVPIPGDQVTLNQADLISAATAEKTALIERLRAFLDETSRQALLERKAAENTAMQNTLTSVPLTIYIG